MSTTQELRRQLEEAERAEKLDQYNKLLQQVTETLHGRCFIRHFKTHNGPWEGNCHAAAVRYNVKKDRRWKDTDPIELELQTVWASMAGKKRGFEEGVGRKSYGTERLDLAQPWKLTELMQQHIREISLKEFNELWDLVNSLGEQMVHRIAQVPNATTMDEPPAAENEPAVDLPHILLTPPESTYVEGWFKLPGYRMLLTANSRKAVLKCIAEERERDARIEHLTEACDMRYLQQKAEALASLERKVREVPSLPGAYGANSPED